MHAKWLFEHDSKGVDRFSAQAMAGASANVAISSRHVHLCSRSCWHLRRWKSRQIALSMDFGGSEMTSISRLNDLGVKIGIVRDEWYSIHASGIISQCRTGTISCGMFMDLLRGIWALEKPSCKYCTQWNPVPVMIGVGHRCLPPNLINAWVDRWSKILENTLLLAVWTVMEI